MAKKKKTKKKTRKKAVKKKSKKTSKKSQKKRKKSKSPKAVKKKSGSPALKGHQNLGKIDDFFSRISVIALRLKGPLSLGETIRVIGHTTDFTQTVGSMQINHQTIQKAGKGDSVGILVGQKCRKGDKVYKLQ